MSLNPGKLQKPLRKLRKMVKRFPRKSSPDLVHDLRIHTRRTEALLQALRLDSKSNEQQLLKAVKPVRKRAGKVRDMDVLTGLVTRLHPDGEQDCLLELLEYLGAEHDRQVRKLRNAVRSRGGEIRRRLKRTSRFIAKFIDKTLARDEKQPGRASGWPADAMAAALELSAELAQWPRLDAENLHPYRLKVKELRYILQLADKPETAFVKMLGDVKDAIGEWHDWQELGGIAKKVLIHGPRCEVLRLIGSMNRTKFEHALSLANRMRQEYLQERERNRKRRQAATHLKRPVMEATSSLAA